MERTPNLRVGVISLESPVWSAGASYSRTLAAGLQLVARDLGLSVFLLGREGVSVPHGVELLPVHDADLSLKGKLVRHSTRIREQWPLSSTEWQVQRRLRWVDTSDPIQVARLRGLDVVVPYVRPKPAHGVRTVGWIPDFQHRGLPDFFPEQEVRSRDAEYARLATVADRMIASSDAVRADFERYLPGLERKVSVLPFPSSFAFQVLPPETVDLVQQYRLPAKFALIVNQFWGHKNHQVLVAATELLRAAGLNVPCVMIGRPNDYRDPMNRTFSGLLQQVATAGVGDLTTILGEVPYDHLISLMRRAAVIVQPSRFEGWSTTVQDARALGRPLICSDIPVLREQVPDALGFFQAQNAPALAEILAEHWGSLEAGPNSDLERASLERERSFARLFGERLARTCYEAAGRNSTSARPFNESKSLRQP